MKPWKAGSAGNKRLLFVGRFAACFALAAAAFVAAPAASAQSFLSSLLEERIRETLTCADEASVSMDPKSLSRSGGGLMLPMIPPPPNVVIGKVREIRPSAGSAGPSDNDIAQASRLSALAYDMYRAHEDGDDPRTAFDASELKLNGLVFGELEAFTTGERERSFYGFLAATRTEPIENLIVLRGTMRAEEWSRNAQISQTVFETASNAGDAKVHEGFYEIYNELEVEDASGGVFDFRAVVRQGAEYANALKFVGHSLGGALATLAAYDASRADPAIASKLSLVTFGSPRVGDYAFAAFAQEIASAVRVCNLVDVVTTLPASHSSATYVHVGSPFKLSSFDHEDKLDNNVPDYNDQVACWHDIDAYTLMLNGDGADPNNPCRAD